MACRDGSSSGDDSRWWRCLRAVCRAEMRCCKFSRDRTQQGPLSWGSQLCEAVSQHLPHLWGVVIHHPASERSRASSASTGREKTFPRTFPELRANPTWHCNALSTAHACYCYLHCKVSCWTQGNTCCHWWLNKLHMPRPAAGWPMSKP